MFFPTKIVQNQWVSLKNRPCQSNQAGELFPLQRAAGPKPPWVSFKMGVGGPAYMLLLGCPHHIAAGNEGGGGLE